MIPVSLSLKGKQVLIVGGGNVALRKTHQFLKEGAIVTILSPLLHPAFKEIDICYIKDKYQVNYLQDMFLVYASTNDLEINHQIVLDCQNRNILCGSAIYDQDVTFYSVASQEHSLGTISLSMHQRLPYIQPLLKQFVGILDDNQEKIEKIVRLRPYILKHVKNKKEYFNRLFDCDIKILDFLYQSLQEGKGTLFVYHQILYKENLQFSLYPYLVLSLSESNQYKDLFVFSIDYHVIPLLLYHGYIYQKIVKMIPMNWNIHQPLIQSKEDIQHIISLYYQENKEMIYLMHPRENLLLKNILVDHIKHKGTIYSFDEDIVLKKNKSYKVVIMLMTHGQHYHHIIERLKIYQERGYDIEYSGTLLDNPQIRQYIENQ